MVEKNKNMKNLLAEKYIGEKVDVITDRPLGTRHPNPNPKTNTPSSDNLTVFSCSGVDNP